MAGLGIFTGIVNGQDDNDEEIDAPDIEVTVGADDELTFDPAQLPLSTGETIAFEWEADGHNLAVTNQPNDADWEGVEEVQESGYTHTHTFEVEGWYEFVSEADEDEDMTGTILVCDIDRPSEEEEDEPTDNESDEEFVDEVDEQVGLAYGETAQVSNGVEVTVYEGTLYDQMGDEVPEDRDRFLVVPVEAENTSDEPRTLPDQTDSWDVLFGNQQLGNVFRYGALNAEGYEAFEGGDVQEGVYREGVLLFEIDEGFEAEEADVLWQDSLWVSGDLDGDIDVRWSADG